MSAQALYARLAWGVVLSVLVVWAMWRTRESLPGRSAAAILLVMGAMWLPGPASPAHWLGLAFQSPSCLLVALCVAALARRVRPGATRTPRLMTPALAHALAGGGALLYADATGWLTIGLYASGFSPVVAPVAGLALGLLGTAWIVTGSNRGTGLPLLAAGALFAFLRLPTGNVFDAVIDPFLWGWALWSVFRLHAIEWRAQPGTSTPPR